MNTKLTLLYTRVFSSLYVIFIILFLSQNTFAQKNVIFPEGAGVVDVTQAPYFAKGDGVTDDTDAINQAMLDHPDGHFIIYLPNGTYSISDRINWPRISMNDTNCSTEQSCRYTILQGQNSDSTVIKLKDSAIGYQNPNERKGVLWCGQGAAQRFRNAVRDLTVNVGSGNAGASGIQFNANNQGGIFDVKVTSDDGQGVYGIDLAYTNEIGPLLIKNVEVDGFQRAISTNFNVNSMTFENVTIRNQSEVGVYIQQQVVIMRGLTSFNEVTAVHTLNQGSHLVLIDSELNGSGNASNQPAIIYGTTVFLRNVTTTGYRNAVTFNLNGTTPITKLSGPFVNEYVSSDVLRLCDNIEKSLNLPVIETPDVPVDDPSTWVNIEDFGAVIDKNGGDDAAAIQAAMNSGASTIYIPVNSFRNGGYTANNNINVPGTVRRIIGTEGGVSGPGKFILTDGDSDIIIERVRNLGGGIQHDANRTLIIKSSFIRGEYTCSSGADLFLEDVGFPPTTFRNQNVWARQYNVESEGISITNDNSNLWILGFKTEKRGTKIRTINGGKTEVLGAHIYSISEPTDEFMFIVEDGSLSLAGIRETNFADNPYQNLIQETRGGVTRTLVAGQANFGINGSGFPLFVGYATEGPNTAPTVEAQRDVSLLLPQDTTILSATVNDDGLPGNSCFNDVLWSQVSGPGNAIIDTPEAVETKVTFPRSGDYVFAVTASDGDLTSTDEIAVYVYDQAITTADHDSDGVPSGSGADAQVSAAGGDLLNYGGDLGISIRNHPTIFDRKGYFKFDISAVSTTIEEAGLDLEISTTNTGLIADWTYNVFGLIESDNYGDGKLDEFWGEGNKTGQTADPGEITYVNGPGNVSSGGGVYNDSLNSGGGVDNNLTKFLGTFQLRQGIREIIQFQSNELTQFLNDDTNGVVTFIITRVDANNNVIAFNAKENTSFSPPTLKLAFEQESDAPAIGEVGVSSTGDQWKRVDLNNIYTNPVVVMGPHSYFGGNNSTVRVRNVDSTSFEWQIDEWEYLDQSHIEETVNYMVIEAGEYLLPNGSKMVANTQQVNTNWATINYPDTFVNLPTILVQCTSLNEAEAVTVRLRKAATRNRFFMKLQEEENGGTLDGNRSHVFETVSWIAIEQGESAGQGTAKFEAADTDNAITDQKWYDILFSQSYSDNERAILGNMQTADGGDPAVIRYNRNSAFDSFSESGIQVFVEEERSNTTENNNKGEVRHTTEVMGYMVFDGIGDFFGMRVNDVNTLASVPSFATEEVKSEISINKLDQDFWLYPNPVVNGELHLELETLATDNVNITISDLSGKVLISRTMSDESRVVLNTSNLKNGIYLVRASINDRVYVRKVFIE